MTVGFNVLEATDDGAAVRAVLDAEGRTDHPGVDWELAGRLGFEVKAGRVQVLAGDGRIVALPRLGPVDHVDTHPVRR
ncbi:MAG TPA: hypothetical protein PKA98_04210, partial [Acidimicrobiales bacterium]|nr:hypothetical protein [Acidimicrobiales bacterium]